MLQDSCGDKNCSLTLTLTTVGAKHRRVLRARGDRAECVVCAQNLLIPEEMRELIVGHIVTVHESVGSFSREFQYKLRRSNYVTPKNYLDFINTYLRLLDEKDKFILNQVRSAFLLLCCLCGNS